MTFSFALGMILALCFSVLLEFAGLLLPSMCPWQPDILPNGYSNAQVLARSAVEQLRAIPGVQHVWGVTGLPNIPASSSRSDIDHVTLCSYDDFMMERSKSMVVNGQMIEPEDNCNKVMTIYNRSNPLKGRRYRPHQWYRPYDYLRLFARSVSGRRSCYLPAGAV